ncbi:MAG: hypothetical protein FWC09_06825 [Lachnospiraceae bacterium]|nr:hypothetical protein [Lachnospiraceae bacterium]
MDKEHDKEYLLRLVADYRHRIDSYFRYIPWLMDRKGLKQSRMYDGDGIGGATISVPVYDSTLLNFVRGMQDTGLMDRNYPYVYSRYGLRDHFDEIERIMKCELKDINVIFGIMSKYVLGGISKGKLWTDAVEEGIFYHSLVRIKEILDMYPLSEE